MRHLYLALSLSLLLPSAALAAPDAEALKSAAAHLDAGTRAFERADYATAVTELKASVDAAPTQKAVLLLGNAYTQAGDFDAALATYERFLQLYPTARNAKTVGGMVKTLKTVGKTRLRIESTPPTATVYLDLRAAGPVGKTPLTLPIAPGRHRVLLELEDYETATVTNVTAVEGQEVVVSVPLKVIGCDITLAISPEGTKTRVDEEQPARTPPTLRVRPGPHKLEFSGAGLASHSQIIVCKDRKPVRVEEKLESSIGTLAVRAPVDATVNVDGKDYLASDAARIMLPPGKHKVRVTAEGKLPWERTVVVTNAEETAVEARLAPAPVVAEAPKKESKPVYKKGWFWGVIGTVAVVGAGAGVSAWYLTGSDSPLRPTFTDDPGYLGSFSALQF